MSTENNMNSTNPSPGAAQPDLSILRNPNIIRLLQEKNEIISMATDNDSVEGRLARNTSDMLCAFMEHLSKNDTTIKDNSINLTNLQDSVKENTTTLLTLEDRVKSLEFNQATLTGRVAQQENENEYLHDLLNDVVAGSMRMNVIINSTGEAYKELRNESNDQTAKLFRDFLRDEMHVANAHKIVIERAHRMGKASETQNRPMIAKLQFQNDINRIFNKVGQLKDSGNFVYIQTPQDYTERKQHSLPTFLDARNQGKKASLLPNGKLIVNGNQVKSLDPVPIPVCASNDLDEVAEEIIVGESDLSVKDTHTFIAHSTQIGSPQDVRDAMDIFVNRFPKAKHVPYAFRFRQPDGSLCEDFKSRRDQGTGPLILKHLRDSKTENIVCFVAHTYDKKTIDGKTKFALIEEVVKSSVSDMRNRLVADVGGENMSSVDEEDASQDASTVESDHTSY